MLLAPKLNETKHAVDFGSHLSRAFSLCDVSVDTHHFANCREHRPLN